MLGELALGLALTFPAYGVGWVGSKTVQRLIHRRREARQRSLERRIRDVHRNTYILLRQADGSYRRCRHDRYYYGGGVERWDN